MKYILAFGTLKKNCPSKRNWNWQRFAGQSYVKDYELNNYDIYSLGPYPAICPGDGKVKCELQTVTDEAFTSINYMELGAGYTPVEVEVEIEGKKEKATVYTWPREKLVGKYEKLDGNWN